MSTMKEAFDPVRKFERTIADYAGSPDAVAVDTGTAALFLCCKYLDVQEVSIPRRTYFSVPCAIAHAGGKTMFDDRTWKGEYKLEPYPIIDSACRFRRGMYRPGTFRCLSFQYRKHVNIGRGGMILTDDPAAARWFRLARFNGREELPLTEAEPEFVGWHCFMEPERAARGLLLFHCLPDEPEDLSFDYPDLSKMAIWRKHVRKHFGEEYLDDEPEPRQNASTRLREQCPDPMKLLRLE